MEIQVSSVVAVQIALTEREAHEFIADPSAVQRRVYELLFSINSKATKALPTANRTPKATHKSGKQTRPSSGTLICTTCGKAFKYRAYFNKHVALCVNAGTAAAS